MAAHARAKLTGAAHDASALSAHILIVPLEDTCVLFRVGSALVRRKEWPRAQMRWTDTRAV